MPDNSNRPLAAGDRVKVVACDPSFPAHRSFRWLGFPGTIEMRAQIDERRLYGLRFDAPNDGESITFFYRNEIARLEPQST